MWRNSHRILDFATGGMLGAGLTGVLSLYLTEYPVANSTKKISKPAGISMDSATQSTSTSEISHIKSTTSDKVNEICAFGLPSSDHLSVFSDYCSSVNFRTRIPNWVAEASQTQDLSPFAHSLLAPFLLLCTSAAPPRFWHPTFLQLCTRVHPVSAHSTFQQQVSTTPMRIENTLAFVRTSL